MENSTAIEKLSQFQKLLAVTEDPIGLKKGSDGLAIIRQMALKSHKSIELVNEIFVESCRWDRKRGQWIKENIQQGGDQKSNSSPSSLILKDIKTSWDKSSYCQRLINIPDEKVVQFAQLCTQQIEQINKTELLKLAGILALKHTGDQENYTPAHIIEDVRAVLGSIDLDPASCELAQKLVKAKAYFTEENNGLKQPWHGNIFLNPPYQMPLIRQFTDKLVEELPNINSAILLTNNSTDTLWFYKCAEYAEAVCFTKGRINFYKADEVRTQPTNGQAFFYFGDNEKVFVEIFIKHGLIMKVV